MVNRGVVFAKSGCGDKARELFRAALLLDPKSPKALYNLAESLRQAGQVAEAAQVFAALLEQDPDHPGAAEGLRRSQSAGAAAPALDGLDGA